MESQGLWVLFPSQLHFFHIVMTCKRWLQYSYFNHVANWLQHGCGDQFFGIGLLTKLAGIRVFILTSILALLSCIDAFSPAEVSSVMFKGETGSVRQVAFPTKGVHFSEHCQIRYNATDLCAGKSFCFCTQEVMDDFYGMIFMVNV